MHYKYGEGGNKKLVLLLLASARGTLRRRLQGPAAWKTMKQHAAQQGCHCHLELGARRQRRDAIEGRDEVVRRRQRAQAAKLLRAAEAAEAVAAEVHDGAGGGRRRERVDGRDLAGYGAARRSGGVRMCSKPASCAVA